MSSKDVIFVSEIFSQKSLTSVNITELKLKFTQVFEEHHCNFSKILLLGNIEIRWPLFTQDIF